MRTAVENVHRPPSERGPSMVSPVDGVTGVPRRSSLLASDFGQHKVPRAPNGWKDSRC